jgi:glycerol-3-phosphate dehydrogenase subunit B
VIGGGIAGTAAALASARGGARVTLVRFAPGATALCMGGWRGPLPAALQSDFAAAAHEWISTSARLPAPDGSLRTFSHAAAAQAAARVQENALVYGIAGLSGFRADVLARLWGDEAGVHLYAAEIAFDDTPAAGWSPASLASRLERQCADLARALSAQVKKTSASAVILPAVLGFEKSESVRKALEQATGCTVGETLAAAPTLPGWRLQAALDKLLARAGIVVEAARVVDRTSEGDRMQAVTLHKRNGEARTVNADAFVLATGKFIGGGIEANDELHEPALNLPVWIDHLGERFERNEPLTLTNAERTEDQPILALGVENDNTGKPISAAGSVIYQNVWLAGAVRAGHALGSAGLGDAAVDGCAAGERALQ